MLMKTKLYYFIEETLSLNKKKRANPDGSGGFPAFLLIAYPFSGTLYKRILYIHSISEKKSLFLWNCK